MKASEAIRTQQLRHPDVLPQPGRYFGKNVNEQPVCCIIGMLSYKAGYPTGNMRSDLEDVWRAEAVTITDRFDARFENMYDEGVLITWDDVVNWLKCDDIDLELGESFN